MKLGKYTIAICLVPHGYEIDLLDHKDYLNGKVTTVHSECRSYGCNIDVEQFSAAIIQGVRDAEKKFYKKAKEMNNITYKRKSDTDTQVRLNGKVVGHIKQAKEGFFYKPSGSKLKGDVFSTLEEVKREIEME